MKKSKKLKNNSVTFFDFIDYISKGGENMQSAADLINYIENLIADVPEPSEEEVQQGIKKILARIGEERKSQE